MDTNFQRKIIAMRGDVGKKWLTRLPTIIKKYEEMWSIKVLAPFPLSYNYVAPAVTTDNQAVVLKIGFPNNKEFAYEAGALAFFNGEGAVKVIKEDLENNVLLLEQLKPGQLLHDIEFEKQVALFLEVAEKLHKPLPSQIEKSFPTLLEWAKDFAVYREMFSLTSGPIPQKLFEKAEEIFTQYPKYAKQQFLLHGDLHNKNILSSQRGWLAIDPKGIIGEKEFEAGIFLRNPIEDLPKNSDHKKYIRDSVAQCAEVMHVDRKRILDWAFATAVNGLVWFLEDEKKFRKVYLDNAQLLDEVLI